MIVYALICAQGHTFDAWFRDSGAFDGQRRDGSLSCPVCGGDEVRKAPMAPRIARGAREHERSTAMAEQAPAAVPNAAPTDAPAAGEAPPSAETFAKLVTLLRHHIETNCENVGNRFAEEARRIHYGESESRGIYGEASPAEASELRDEGITVQPIPWFFRRND